MITDMTILKYCVLLMVFLNPLITKAQWTIHGASNICTGTSYRYSSNHASACDSLYWSVTGGKFAGTESAVVKLSYKDTVEVIWSEAGSLLVTGCENAVGSLKVKLRPETVIVEALTALNDTIISASRHIRIKGNIQSGPGKVEFRAGESIEVDTNVEISPEVFLYIDDCHAEGGIITSLSSIDHKSIFSFRPNPANDKVTIDYKGNSAKIVISNAEGKVVLSERLLFTEKEVNVEGLAQGIYLLEVVTEAGVERKKIVIQR